jgi:hypothetical protein
MIGDVPGLRKLEKRSLEPAIRMLTRAFWSYPLLTHFCPEESKRQKLSDNLMAVPVYTCFRYGEVYVTSDHLEGAAVWTPSSEYPVSFWRLLRSVPLRHLLGTMNSSTARLNMIDSQLNEIHQRLAPYPHYYLEILGVDPEHQKKGFSSRLIKPVLQILETQNLACYLETQDPRDVIIYQHFGFNVIDESAIPDTPLSSWAMLFKTRS